MPLKLMQTIVFRLHYFRNSIVAAVPTNSAYYSLARNEHQVELDLRPRSYCSRFRGSTGVRQPLCGAGHLPVMRQDLGGTELIY